MKTRHTAPVPAPAADRRLQDLEKLSYYMDEAIRIPGIGYRVGWDAVIGLIPGAGDAVGLLISAYIVLQAARMGLPKSTIFRMLGNVGIEAVVGAVPLLGDVFDAGWKANRRNIRLARKHLGQGAARAHKSNALFFYVVIGLFTALLLGVGIGLAWLIVAALGAANQALGF